VYTIVCGRVRFIATVTARRRFSTRRRRSAPALAPFTSSCPCPWSEATVPDVAGRPCPSWKQLPGPWVAATHARVDRSVKAADEGITPERVAHDSDPPTSRTRAVVGATGDMRVLTSRLSIRPAQPASLTVNKVSKDLFMGFVHEVLLQPQEGFANHE
jgi:hypothetical protein